MIPTKSVASSGLSTARRKQWQRIQQIRFGEPPEHFWSKNEIAAACRDEHPEWGEESVQRHAQTVFDALEDERTRWYNSQRRLHRHAFTVGLSPTAGISKLGD